MSAVTARDAGSRVAELFDAHARMVLGVCRLILRDPVEAEDAAQQTFLSAYRSLLGGTEPHEPASWLATIARNECRARLKRREPPTVPVDGATVRDVSELADERERIDVLASAIADLPERQRQAVVLRDLRGLSYAEVAEVLDVPSGAAEALVGRGRRRVRTAFRRARPSVLVLPATLRNDLARLIPHFEAATAAAGGAGVAGAGAVKLAVAVTAVAVAVGGSVEADRVTVVPPSARAAPKVERPKPHRHRVTLAAVRSTPAPTPRPLRRSSERHGSDDAGSGESSGPGPGTGTDATSNSGPGSGSVDSSGPGPGTDDLSGDGSGGDGVSGDGDRSGSNSGPG